jgi:PEP-CTERM motif
VEDISMKALANWSKVALILFGVLVASQGARADSCTTGTLNSFAGTTCTIGDLSFTFGSASFANTNNGAGPVTGADFTLTPDSSNPLHPGFSLEGNLSAFSADGVNGASILLTFPFTIVPLNGNGLVQWDGTLLSYSLRPGTLGALAELDSDQCFTDPQINGCTGLTAGVLVGPHPFSMPSNSSLLFLPITDASFMGDIELMARTFDGQGFAQISDSEFHYSLQTPEPASLALLGSALLACAALIRRRISA